MAMPLGIALEGCPRVDELAARYGGTVDAAVASTVLRAVAPIHSAGAEELAPLTSARHLELARASKAVLLVDAQFAARCREGARWIHPHAGWVLACLLEQRAGADPATAAPPLAAAKATALVSPQAQVDPTARIGPGVVVLPGAVVGPYTTIEPNAVLYGRVRVGARVAIGACSVVGRPGFGWVSGPDGAIRRMPQLGGVVLEDDVEIGPLCTVDAGTLGPTIIRRGAKLDAQVHVGHNGDVGEWVMVAAQSGFAGSVRIGGGVLVGGQSGIADHVVVGASARLAAKSGVIGDIPAGAVVAGYPAVDRVRWLRGMARLLRVGERRKQSPK